MSNMIPFLPLMFGAIAALFLRGWTRNIIMLAAPIVGALNLMGLEHGVFWAMEFMGYALEPVKIDKLSLMFGYLFHFVNYVNRIFNPTYV